MRFIEVDRSKIAKKPMPSTKHDIVAELEEFLKMNVPAVRIVFGKDEFSNLRSAVCSIRKTIMTCDFPIKARYIENNIYLIRTDI